jgi:hypothetical protein
LFPLDYVLAVALLTALADATDLTGSAEGWATLQPALQAVAVGWEILDPREARYVLTRPKDFAADLQLLRRRYHDLADAPPLQDALRFPSRDLINELLAFNRAYRQHLTGRQSLELTSWWELHETLQEADRLYQIWDAVRDARCDYYYVTVRSQALKKLTFGSRAHVASTSRAWAQLFSSHWEASASPNRKVLLVPSVTSVIRTVGASPR